MKRSLIASGMVQVRSVLLGAVSLDVRDFGAKRGGPKTVAIKLCQYVTIRGVTVKNSPNYSISLWGADYVNVDGVTILNGLADGIDPDASRYVRISNCYIDAHDDAIRPKAGNTRARAAGR